MTGEAVHSSHMLLEAAKRGTLMHAVFVTGGDALVCSRLIKRACASMCMHTSDVSSLSICPDYFEYDGAALKIDTVRELIGELVKRPFLEGKRAVFIYNAGEMNMSVQNALLKSLEEPPDGTVFFLTGNTETVLPTILSRCALIRETPYTSDEIRLLLMDEGASSEDAALYSCAGVTYTRAQKLCFSEDEREFRKLSIQAFARSLAGDTALDTTKQLCAQKRGPDAVDYMLSYARDILTYKVCSRINENPDVRDAVVKAAVRFTIGTITVIIAILNTYRQRISRDALPALSMDRLFIEITEATA